MATTNPDDLLPTLHLIRAALESGLLTKEEVIDWADKIITEDEQPDIFFIDLALSSRKSLNDIITYFDDYLWLKESALQVRPLLGLLYKQFSTGQLTLDETVGKLYSIKDQGILTEREKGYIYSIDDFYDYARDGIRGTPGDVHEELAEFLGFYKEYSIDNFEQWQHLAVAVEYEIERDIKLKQKEAEALRNAPQKTEKPWWKFWV